MRKWTSNARDIISDLPSDQLLFENFLKIDAHSTAKTLGIRWNAQSDQFFFSVIPFPSICKYTKREILSQISKLFDPAGWLAPCIVTAKIIMQQIWMENTNWDEKISSEILSKWKSFQSTYPSISSIQIPRWFNYVPSSEIQLHGFSDASERAYAAVLYIRIKHNDTIRTYLIS